MATVGLIYLGNFKEADTDESNWSNENDDVFEGLHGNAQLQALKASVTTPNRDGVVYDDESGIPSTITYDLGEGRITANQDMVARYNVSILLGDGSTLKTVVNVIQLVNGDTFINETDGGTTLDGLSIQSIKIDSLIDDNAKGWWTSSSAENISIVCFARGTQILTGAGPRPVEGLAIGDLVWTLDHGLLPIEWIHCRRMRATGPSAPVTIEPGALGPGMPHRRLVLSAQHRILLRSPIVEKICGMREVFLAAKHLVGLPGIRCAERATGIVYLHFMLETHAVVLADGALTECFLPGAQAMKAISERDRATIGRIVQRHPAAGRLCRPVADPRARRAILRAHRQRGTPLILPEGAAAAGCRESVALS